MAVPTHVLEHVGGTVTSFAWSNVEKFAVRLRRFNGTDRFAMILWALPPGMDYEDAVDAGANREYIQAAGRADALTVEICKPGGAQWGVDWVRYVIGHPHGGGDAVRDVPIVLPNSTEMRSRFEVFNADEAAQLFDSYFRTGDIPAGYTLHPEQGFTRDGGNVDLRDQVPPQP